MVALATFQMLTSHTWLVATIWDDADKKYFWEFPGGAVVKNPPANAGDTGLISGPGRSHMPWSS